MIDNWSVTSFISRTCFSALSPLSKAVVICNFLSRSLERLECLSNCLVNVFHTSAPVSSTWHSVTQAVDSDIINFEYAQFILCSWSSLPFSHGSSFNFFVPSIYPQSLLSIRKAFIWIFQVRQFDSPSSTYLRIHRLPFLRIYFLVKLKLSLMQIVDHQITTVSSSVIHLGP